MRIGAVVAAAVLTLSFGGGSARAQDAPSVTEVTARVTAVDASEGSVTVETVPGVAPFEIGDEVKVMGSLELPSSSVPAPVRRAVAVCSLLMIGTILTFRARRPRTI